MVSTERPGFGHAPPARAPAGVGVPPTCAICGKVGCTPRDCENKCADCGKKICPASTYGGKCWFQPGPPPQRWPVNAHGRAYHAEMMNRIDTIRARELNPSASVAKLDEARTDNWSEQLACFDNYDYKQTGTAENDLRAHAASLNYINESDSYNSDGPAWADEVVGIVLSVAVLESYAHSGEPA